MTKKKLDNLRKTTRKLRLTALLFYSLGTIITASLISVKSDSLIGVFVLVFALFFHLLSEVINNEYKQGFSKEINKNKRTIRL